MKDESEYERWWWENPFRERFVDAYVPVPYISKDSKNLVGSSTVIVAKPDTGDT